MTEKEISKKQTIWLRQYDESHNIQYIVSSNTIVTGKQIGRAHV